MAYRAVVDLTSADWIIQSRVPDLQLATFGPSGFEQYCRLRTMPDPSFGDQDQLSVMQSIEIADELTLISRAAGHLSKYTTTPQECFVGLWDGWPYQLLPPDVMPDSYITCGMRRFFVLQGSAEEISSLTDIVDYPIPALVWPADRSWCISYDVDVHWAGIGASTGAIDALLGDADLDVVLADPTELQPVYMR